MKAINPKTGKPITIMRSAATITKTNRTVIWHPGAKQNRWSVIITEDDPVEPADIVFLYGKPTEELKQKWVKWLVSRQEGALLIATPTWLEALRLNAATDSSLLATTELYQRYPYLPDLKETDSKEAWVLSICQLMRFNRLITNKSMDNSAQIFKGLLLQEQQQEQQEQEQSPPQVWLIQQYYQAPRKERAKELSQVLEKNINNPYIDKIVLLNEKIYDSQELQSPKIQQVNIGHRLTYYDVLTYIKNDVPKDTIVVFSNSDIYLDNTLRQLYSLDLDKKFLALLRYDMPDDILFGPRADSQDTWILWSSSVDFDVTQEEFGFNFGVPGCDNAITVAMLKKKFAISNPALSIKSYHVHASNIRNYVASDVLDKPIFLYVEPTAIQDYNIQTDLISHKTPTWPKVTPRSFSRPIKCVDKTTAETICRMMSKSDNPNAAPYNYSTESPNIFNKAYDTKGSQDNQLYTFTSTSHSPIFTMPAGIVCDYTNLFVGTNPVWKEEWSRAPLTILTNTIHVPEMAAVHFPQEIANSASQWFLRYLPNILKIYLHTDKNPEFIVSIHPDTQRALSILNWTTDKEVTMIPYLSDCQYVSETVYALTPPSFKEIPPENIDLLRTLLPKKEKEQQDNNTPQVVICAERTPDHILSHDYCNQLIKNIFHRKERANWNVVIVDVNTPTETRLQALMRADLVIAASESEWDAADWCWLMQPDKTIAEVMPDTKPRGDHIHIAGAANLNYVLLGTKREPLPQQRQHLLEDVEKLIQQHMFSQSLRAEVPKAHLPNIVLPSGKALKGIYEHAGDTFREMVHIWQDRGYCTVEYREDTPHVWWHSVGNVLLYDRPTMRWFNNPAYNLALFGNAIPEKPQKTDRLWSFWSRSPKAVESIVATNKPLTQYEDRTIPSIFLGKIENGVQKERRTTHDWDSVIHTFHMPTDSSGGPYKYSQEEYLSLLCQSRFGVCLPGFGPKCNREIEYFATGTVPIITPGIDISNYASKPKENVHYFTAKTPEDIKRLIETITPEKWTEMSIACRAWWRRYASAEGLFRLTWGIVNEHQHQHGPHCQH
jgi:hypothetical protein